MIKKIFKKFRDGAAYRKGYHACVGNSLKVSDLVNGSKINYVGWNEKIVPKRSPIKITIPQDGITKFTARLPDGTLKPLTENRYFASPENGMMWIDEAVIVSKEAWDTLLERPLIPKSNDIEKNNHLNDAYGWALHHKMSDTAYREFSQENPYFLFTPKWFAFRAGFERGFEHLFQTAFQRLPFRITFPMTIGIAVISGALFAAFLYFYTDFIFDFINFFVNMGTY